MKEHQRGINPASKPSGEGVEPGEDWFYDYQTQEMFEGEVASAPRASSCR